MTDHLDQYLGPGSPLQLELAGFAYRPEQLDMARRILRAMSGGAHLAVEAAAGTGKTLAYLVPALMSGQRVIIATGTRTLQDQLYFRDLPLVSRAIGRPATVSQLKGRANYLCRYRLRRALGQPERLPSARRHELRLLGDWSGRTNSGDISEVARIAEHSEIWPLVTSTADNCLGARCPDIGDCHVVAARKAAAESTIAVVNHHLLLADMTLREDGFASLLPGADVVIVDEAHRFPEIAQTLFDVTLSSRQVSELARDVRSEVLHAGTPSPALDTILADIHGDLREAVRWLPQTEPVTMAQAGEETARALLALAADLQALTVSLAEVRDLGAGLGRCHDRATAISAAAARIAGWQEESDLCWVRGGGQGFAVHLTPLDASRQVQQLVEAQPGTWIFTSATLAVGEDFSHFTGRLGSRSIETYKISSPFDFSRCARLYLPDGLPAPDTPDYTERVVSAVAPVIESSRGRAFMLFTSRRALQRAAQILSASHGGHTLLVQGSAPRSRLIDQFASTANAVLLGTATFWEGVDIRGPALVVVAIDRLPFASPGDPFLQARLELIRRGGGDPFRDYQLPQAVLALRQGVGRLIRGPGDYGVVVVCDPRLRTRGYGRVFLAALPPIPVTHDLGEVRAFLAAHEGVAA